METTNKEQLPEVITEVGFQEAEILANPVQEEKSISVMELYKEGVNRGKKQLSQIYPREIARQQHITAPTTGSLFDILNPEAKKHAIQLRSKGNLLSSLVEGIDGGELSTKVIIALIQVLNEQSDLKQPESIKKNSELIANSFGYTLRQTPTAGALSKYEQSDKEKRPIALCPFIIIKITDFVRRVLSLPPSTKVTGKDKNRVRDTLDELRVKEVFYKCANNHHRSITLIRGMNKDIDAKTKEEIRIIELDGIFIKNLQHDFVTLPSDILQRLKGRQSTMTMRLFWFLVEQFSYHKHTYPNEKKNKSDLFSEIAIIERYKEHPSEREKDFKKSIEKMKEIRLIKSYEEKPSELGEHTCIFTFDDDFVIVKK
jgi:hypothetical protein